MRAWRSVLALVLVAAVAAAGCATKAGSGPTADRLYVMGHGRIVFGGTAAALRDNDAVRREWLEV